MSIHNFQSLDEVLKEFHKFYVEGYYGKETQGVIDFHEYLASFIRSVWQSAQEEEAKKCHEHCETARKEERERVREMIESKGHQQDDDTIWCNMDELLELIKQP